MSARLPLGVGTTAHASFTRAVVPLLVGLVFGAVGVDMASGGELAEPGDWIAVVITFGLAALAVAYSAFHLYRAYRLRASDLVIDARSLRVRGGMGSGVCIGWAELDPPYAEVEHALERQLSFWGGLALVFLRAGWPVKRVDLWKLWLYRGGEALLVAKADREIEAQSMRAAVETVAAIAKGRRYVAGAPAVPVRGLLCPICGAPASPDDAPEVRCLNCDGRVPVDAAMREQAAAARVLADSRDRVTRITRKLLRQPRAGARRACRPHQLGVRARIVGLQRERALERRGGRRQVVGAAIHDRELDVGVGDRRRAAEVLSRAARVVMIGCFDRAQHQAESVVALFALGALADTPLEAAARPRHVCVDEADPLLGKRSFVRALGLDDDPVDGVAAELGQ